MNVFVWLVVISTNLIWCTFYPVLYTITLKRDTLQTSILISVPENMVSDLLIQKILKIVLSWLFLNHILAMDCSYLFVFHSGLGICLVTKTSYICPGGQTGTQFWTFMGHQSQTRISVQTFAKNVWMCNWICLSSCLLPL